jgi:HK97 gp10 family phage protein
MPARTRRVAGFSASVVIKFDHTKEVGQKMNQRMHEIVDESALAVQTRASQIAPVDTGALRNSIYVNNGDQSDYNLRTATARGLNPDMNALEEIDPEFVIAVSSSPGVDSYISVVGVAADYGLFQELGTRHHRAQPFMLPSALGVQDDFEQAMTHVADP